MEVLTPSVIDLQKINRDFESFILSENHPCIMAKAVFRKHHYDLHAYGDMHSGECLHHVLRDLGAYVEGYDFSSTQFKTFVAVFPNNEFKDEMGFEKALWCTLQRMHLMDEQPWDEKVSHNPEDAAFSFSLHGKAFYIIGMHPQSSRMARQAPYTTLVFNLHCQFEKLREIGNYQKVRDRIRQNDEQLQGSVNPVLKDFGDDSETRQYSGRHVENDWKCPFHPKTESV